MPVDQCPPTAYLETRGLRYFPRMLQKIRLFATDQLRPDFHENLGKGLDRSLCDFLHIDYAQLRERVLEGGTDEEVFAWCEKQSRELNAGEVRIWNDFVTKLGWHDAATPRLEERKAESGLADRDDIVTMIEYFEYDEGRKK